jgi:hypothetical protein
MNHALDDLLLFWIQDLCKALVELWLLLLQLCEICTLDKMKRMLICGTQGKIRSFQGREKTYHQRNLENSVRLHLI